MKKIFLVALSLFISTKAYAGGGHSMGWLLTCKGISVNDAKRIVKIDISTGSRAGAHRYYDIALSDGENVLFMLNDYVPSKEARYQLKEKELFIAEDTVLASMQLELRNVKGKHEGQFLVRLGNRGERSPFIGSESMACKPKGLEPEDLEPEDLEPEDTQDS